MAAGYQVTLDELAAVAGTFGHEGETLGSVADGLPDKGPDTGGSGLNATLTAVLAATAYLSATLADRVSQHGTKLTGAHDTYRRTDTDNKQLFDDLMKSGT
jgi:hypothetical protein